MSRYRSKRRKKAIRKRVYGIIIGSCAAIFLLVILGLLVFNDNLAGCAEVGLSADLRGCVVNDEYKYDSITFVVGNTANSPKPTLDAFGVNNSNPLSIKKYLANSSTDTITVFSVASGGSKQIPGIKIDGDTIGDLKEEVLAQFKNVDEAISTPPTMDGANYIDTISRAVNHASSQSRGDKKSLVIIIGSGLSDRGSLDFANNDYLGDNGQCRSNDPEEESEEMMNKIAAIERGLRANSLSDSVEVIWYALGQTTKPQAELGSYSYDLRIIYKNILNYLGISSSNIKFDDTSFGDESIKTNFFVKTTRVPDTYELSFGEDAIRFLANSQNFVDRNAAKQTLREKITFCPSSRIEIEGYVAMPCDGKEDKTLAQNRADAVKELIGQIAEEFGHRSVNIIANGMGHGQYNECANGYFDESIAQANRYVKVKVSSN